MSFSGGGEFTMTLAAGTRLGAYEISGTLGAGGMDEVYRPTDIKLGREITVKILWLGFSTPLRIIRLAGRR